MKVQTGHLLVVRATLRFEDVAALHCLEREFVLANDHIIDRVRQLLSEVLGLIAEFPPLAHLGGVSVDSQWLLAEEEGNALQFIRECLLLFSEHPFGSDLD